MRAFCATLALALSAHAAAPSSAPGATPPAAPVPYESLLEATQAVVAVKAHVPESARSARTLGTDRSGSGVLISADGLVLTIGYLLLEADRIEVTSSGGRTVPAGFVAYDHATGFGIVKPLAPLGVKPIRMGSSASVDLLDRVISVSGGDEGLEAATVVSKRRFAGYWEYLIDDAIFTSPPRVDHSGAALIDREGRLVGIGSLFVMDAAHPGERLPGNMFVPIDLLTPILDEMVATGRQKGGMRPWLGLSAAEEDGRLKVIRTSTDGPAAKAGIVPGDILLQLGDERVTTLEDFYRRLWTSGAPGVEVRLRVLQGAEVRDLRVRTIDRADYSRRRPSI